MARKPEVGSGRAEVTDEITALQNYDSVGGFGRDVPASLRVASASDTKRRYCRYRPEMSLRITGIPRLGSADHRHRFAYGAADLIAKLCCVDELRLHLGSRNTDICGFGQSVISRLHIPEQCSPRALLSYRAIV